MTNKDDLVEADQESVSEAWDSGLERKYCQARAPVTLLEGKRIEGYASLFDITDQGRDVVAQGAYTASLRALRASCRTVKMLWQHDPAQPIGVWDEIVEDNKGLRVKGRLLEDVARGREAAKLIEAGAIDGLSIGYRTKRASKTGEGGRRLLEVDLWEISLVTFPMLPQARLGSKSHSAFLEGMSGLTHALTEARRALRPTGR